MKSIAVTLAAIILTSTALADIQSPPLDRYTWERKLSRGVANIVFAVSEIPVNIAKVNREEGGTIAYTHGIIDGAIRTVRRALYGAYEVVTFPAKAHYDSYRPYRIRKRSIDQHPYLGYHEFPPHFSIHENFAVSRRRLD